MKKDLSVQVRGVNMLIRSQDKKHLVNFDFTMALSIREAGINCFCIYCYGTDLTLNMAKYSTEGKAIKALDLIERARIRDQRSCDMPKEEEV